MPARFPPKGLGGPVGFLIAGTLPILGTAACMQLEQSLPFEADESAVSEQLVTPLEGGTVSLPSGLAITIPPGAVSSSVQVRASRLITRPFPAGEGTVIPGTAYEILPAGLALDAAARVEIRVQASDVAAEDRIRLGIGLETALGPTLLSGGSFDATSGILSGYVTELGAVAALLATDALGVDPGTPPTLEGGSFGTTAGGAPPPTTVGALETLRFGSTCAPTGRRCFNSGLLKAWISPELRERLGSNIQILGSTVVADMEFSGFDLNGQPTTAVGTFQLIGTLRARVGQSVNSYDIDRRVRTGFGAEPTPTPVSVSGSTLIFAETSDGPGEEIEYSVHRIGTGQMLTVRMEDEVTLDNADGTTTTGTVIIHLRLRR